MQLDAKYKTIKRQYIKLVLLAVICELTAWALSDCTAGLLN